VRREGKGTVEVGEFVKRCFNGEAVFVRVIGGLKAGWEEKVWRVVEASSAEKGDWMVRSGLAMVAVCRVGLMDVL